MKYHVHMSSERFQSRLANFDGNPRHTKEVEVTLDADGMIIRDGDESTRVPFGQITLRRDEGDKKVTRVEFEHYGRRQWVFIYDVRYTDAWKGLARNDADRELFRAVNSSFRKRKGSPWAVLIIIGLSIVGLAILAFITAGILTIQAARLIPPEIEYSIGQSGAEAMIAESSLCSSEDMEGLIAGLTDELAAVLDDHPYEFTVAVLDEDDPNAFALPGGFIFIHSGLIEASETVDELAGVLAHEMIHVVEQHGMRNLISSVGLRIGLLLLVGDISLIELLLVNNISELTSLAYSRGQETEADLGAVDVLVDAGYNPQGLARFLATIQELEEEFEGTEAPLILRTHPFTEDRIQRLEQRTASLDLTVPLTPMPTLAECSR